jgi:hypothetical protein
MIDEEKFTGWSASLSDGRTAFESPPVPGEASSWQKLLALCKEKNLKITRLRLFRGKVRLMSMPQKMCDGYFQAYEQSKSVFAGDVSMKQGIGSVIGDEVHINWIDDDGNVWQDVRPLSECRIHTTLGPPA